MLAPVLLGVLMNSFFPKLCQAITPFSPLVGVAATVVLVGGSVAPSGSAIVEAGMKLQVSRYDKIVSIHLTCVEYIYIYIYTITTVFINFESTNHGLTSAYILSLFFFDKHLLNH